MYLYFPKNLRLHTTCQLHNKNLLEGAYTDDIHLHTHPVNYTIFTDNIAPPKKEKSSSDDNTTKLKTLITFIHKNNIDIMNQKVVSQTVKTGCIKADTLVLSRPSNQL